MGKPAVQTCMQCGTALPEPGVFCRAHRARPFGFDQPTRFAAPATNLRQAERRERWGRNHADMTACAAQNPGEFKMSPGIGMGLQRPTWIYPFVNAVPRRGWLTGPVPQAKEVAHG